jgi:hypothetical protein
VPYASGMEDPSPESRFRPVIVVIIAAVVIVGVITLSVVYGKGNPLISGIGRGIGTAIGVGVVVWLLGRRVQRRGAQLERTFPGSLIFGLLPFRSVRVQVQDLRSRLHQDGSDARWSSTSRPFVVVNEEGLTIWLANLEAPLLRFTAGMMGEITAVDASIRGTWIPISERAHSVRLALTLPDGPATLDIPVDGGVGTGAPVKAGASAVAGLVPQISRALGRA